MRHLLDTHIPIVNAFDTILGSFGEKIGLCHFHKVPLRRGPSYEALTTTIGQRASILQCLDRPIENALGLVKIGENWGKLGESIIGF